MHAGIDLEAQNPCNWISEVKHALRADRETAPINKLGFNILKVPDHKRQPSEDFTPQAWRFGLHNRENIDTTGSEAIKLSVAVALGLVGEKWDAFCKAVVDDPGCMKQCYGLQEECRLSDEEIRYVLALDALFLALLNHSYKLNNMIVQGISWDAKVRYLIHQGCVFDSRWDAWGMSIGLDVCKIENQIQFVLVERVVQHLTEVTFKSNVAAIQGNDEDGKCVYLTQLIEIAVQMGTFGFMDVSGEFFQNQKLDIQQRHLQSWICI